MAWGLALAEIHCPPYQHWHRHKLWRSPWSSPWSSFAGSRSGTWPPPPAHRPPYPASISPLVDQNCPEIPVKDKGWKYEVNCFLFALNILYLSLCLVEKPPSALPATWNPPIHQTFIFTMNMKTLPSTLLERVQQYICLHRTQSGIAASMSLTTSSTTEFWTFYHSTKSQKKIFHRFKF